MNNLWSLDMLVLFTRALQEEIAEVAARKAVPVTCLPGCSHCCRWPVAASVLEGLVLVDWLVQNRAWSRSLRDRVLTTADKVTALAYDVWRCADIPCPLLADNGTCRAWPARPIACRLAASTGSPDACHPHVLPSATGIVPPVQELIEFRMREGGVMQTHGIRPNTMPLATAILVAGTVRRERLLPRQLDQAVLIEYVRRLL